MSFPKLNQKQIDKLSDIASDMALVSTASIALPAVFDKYDVNKIAVGVTLAILFWMLSLWLKK